jgi:hypothetical protein
VRLYNLCTKINKRFDFKFISLHIRQRSNTDPAPKLLHQNGGAGLKGCTGGKNIIYQEDMGAPTGNSPAISVESIGILYAVPTLLPLL